MKKNKNGDYRGCYSKSLEQRMRIARTLTGRKNGPPSKETILKISEGLKNSKKHKAHADRMRGVPRSLKICLKISQTRKKRGLGFAPTEFAKKLKRKLGKDWKLEYYFHWRGRRGAFPVDIANPKIKMAIECDGKSHDYPAQKLMDKKKDAEIQAQGWVIVHIKEV